MILCQSNQKIIRCEGYHRTGGAFTLGPVVWSQCPNEAMVQISFKQNSVLESMPACFGCWDIAISDGNIEIFEVRPIMINENIEE